MESAAAWSRYWQVLEQVDDPDAKPDLQLFDEILSRTDIKGTSTARAAPGGEPAHARAGDAGRRHATRRGAPRQQLQRSFVPSSPLVGALHRRERPLSCSTARPAAAQGWSAAEAAGPGQLSSPYEMQQQQQQHQHQHQQQQHLGLRDEVRSGSAVAPLQGGGETQPGEDVRGHVPKLNLVRGAAADTAPAQDQPLGTYKPVPSFDSPATPLSGGADAGAGAGAAGGSVRAEARAPAVVSPRPRSPTTRSNGVGRCSSSQLAPHPGDSIQYALGGRRASGVRRMSVSQDQSVKPAYKPESRYKEVLERVAKKKQTSAASQVSKDSHAVLGAWGLKQGAELQQQYDKLSGAAEQLQRPQSLVSQAEAALDLCDAQVQGMQQALQLLQTFSLGTIVRPKFQGHLQEAEEILQELVDEQHQQQHQHQHQHQHQQQHQQQKDQPLRELLRPLPKPPLEFPASGAWDYLVAAQRRLGGVDALEVKVKQMRSKVQVLLEKGAAGGSNLNAAGMPSMLSVPAVSRFESPSRQQQQQRSSQTSVISFDGPADSTTESNPLVAFFSASRHGGGTAAEGTWPERGYAAGRIPEDGSCTSIGDGGELRGGGRSPGRRSGAVGQGPAPRSRLSAAGAGAGGGTQCSDEGDELWQWLENLVSHMQGAGSARLEWSSGMEHSLPEMHAFNPYTSTGPKHEVAVDRLVSMVKAFQDHYNVSEAEALRHVSRQQAPPAVERNVLQAAALSSVDPDHLQRVLYLMMRLATSMGSGVVRPCDASVLLLGSLELLLREVQWLLSLLQLTQGPISPHLQALHAVLKAYEAQTVYSGKLRSRAEELQACVEDAVDRAEASERQAEVAMAAHHEQSLASDKLLRRNEELELEVRQLKARLARSG